MITGLFMQWDGYAGIGCGKRWAEKGAKGERRITWAG